jgi:hypothetical protein
MDRLVGANEKRALLVGMTLLNYMLGGRERGGIPARPRESVV